MGLLSLHKTVFIWPLDQLTHSKNPQISLAAINFKFLYKRINLRIRFDHDSKLFYIIDGVNQHFFGDLQRGRSLYINGLKSRGKELFHSYLLNNVDFSSDDIVIDCGANYADLWLALNGLIDEKKYITFEPGVRENSSIIKNAPNGVHNLKGLSNKEEITKYYVNERDADSSIVEPVNFTHILEIETTTLQKYVNDNAISKIKLFKLEAEGFEPEILEGALGVLDMIEYIALDGGYERGKEQTETFSELCNVLQVHGFNMVTINFREYRALFVNKL